MRLTMTEFVRRKLERKSAAAAHQQKVNRRRSLRHASLESAVAAASEKAPDLARAERRQRAIRRHALDRSVPRVWGKPWLHAGTHEPV